MATRATQSLAQGNVAFLRQGLDLIGRIGDDDFRGTAPGGGRGGVGAHFRHVIDHYDCFLAGLERGQVDYDRRARDAAVETDRERSGQAIAEIERRLALLARTEAERPLSVLVDCGEPGERVASSSTVARELQFLVSHTVHHYAVIALILRARGRDPGPEFGVAPSTLKYERGNTACAR